MANWSETIVRFYGKRENIKKADELIKKFTEPISYGYETLYINPFYNGIDEGSNKIEEVFGDLKEQSFYTTDLSSMRVDEYNITDSLLEITGQGRWEAPFELFAMIAVKSGCKMDFYDAEVGSDFYFEAHYAPESGLLTEMKKGYYCHEMVENFYNGDIWEFLGNENWYFEPGAERDENFEELLYSYNLTREEVQKELYPVYYKKEKSLNNKAENKLKRRENGTENTGINKV